MIRWAWRLFRREWRQQVLVVALLAVAVAATVLGVAVAANAPADPTAATFGTASAQLTVPGTDPHLAADIVSLRRQFGTIDVIENAGSPARARCTPSTCGPRTRAGRTGGRCWRWCPGAIPTGRARSR